MYHGFKKIALGVLPKGLLYKAEPTIRSAVSAFYKGKNHQCPVCEIKLKKFVLNTNGYDLICPKCASIQRKRLLWLYLHKELSLGKNKPVMLDFSPNRNIMKRLKVELGKNYHTTDYENPRTEFQYDITNINCADEMYDLIVCYHVLEHIPNDKQAMKELYRILKPGGTLLTQVPFRESSATLEDAQINTPELRKKHYGQDDHVRYYGKQDFIDRLEATGFKVNPMHYAKTFSAEEVEYYGLNEQEVIFVCSK